MQGLKCLRENSNTMGIHAVFSAAPPGLAPFFCAFPRISAVLKNGLHPGLTSFDHFGILCVGIHSFSVSSHADTSAPEGFVELPDGR